MQFRLVMSRNVGHCIEERSAVIFRPMVNSGSIPEGEQKKIVVYSYVGCSLIYIRAVLSCPVLLSPHEYGLVQFSIISSLGVYQSSIL